jgi:hypothetical protein
MKWTRISCSWIPGDKLFFSYKSLRYDYRNCFPQSTQGKLNADISWIPLNWFQIVLYLVTNVSEELIASIFRVCKVSLKLKVPWYISLNLRVVLNHCEYQAQPQGFVESYGNSRWIAGFCGTLVSLMLNTRVQWNLWKPLVEPHLNIQ